MPAHVDDDALLRLIVRERFPTWKSVLNEQAAAQLLAETRERRRLRLVDVLGPDEVPDRLAVQRRKRLIQERQVLLNEGLETLPVDYRGRAAE